MKIVQLNLKFTLFFLLIFTSFSLFSYEWKAALKTDTFANHTDDANVLTASLSAKGNIELTNMFSLVGQIDINWRTGRAQSWYGYDANEDGLRFSNAYLLFNPSDLFTMQFGAINTKYLDSPSLITATFPGIKENIIFKFNNITTEISAFQAIPTSSSLNVSRSEKEKLPFFAVENIKISYKNDLLKSSLFANHFQFQNLPSKVAYESSFMGNHTLGYFESDSSFLFGFNGFSFGGSIGYQITDKIELALKYNRVENSEALYGYGRNEFLELNSNIIIGSDILTPSIGLFYNESDSSPAYYNSSKMGHNNRQGYSLGLAYKFNKKGFKVSAKFVDADLIDLGSDLVNSREQYIFLKLETNFKKL